MTSGDAHWLSRAIDLAVANVRAGGGPFGAITVRDGELLSTGVNRVVPTLDPTAHAEVVAIRAACQETRDFALPGVTLYSSCEPCPLCLAAALWSRIDRVVYAADRDDAAAAGFDDRRFSALFAQPPSEWPMPVTSLDVPESRAPFRAWEAEPNRVPY